MEYCISIHYHLYNLVFYFSHYSYGYLSYETAEEAKEAAEKYKDIEMDGKKLLVVHYGTYIDPVSPTSKCQHYHR